ncbi:MAG: DUF2061 domain-containing protein [Candidatus Saccharimonadales bacterium]
MSAKSKRRRSQHKRSIAKAITWRITGSLDTFVIAWVITGSAHQGAAIGGTEIITKTVLYYFHERGWNRISFGLYDDYKSNK